MNGTTPQSPRMVYIDALRALAMLAVVLFHASLYSGPNHLVVTVGSTSLDLAWPLQFGHFGVNLFLLLSGFCLYWQFVKSAAREQPTLAVYAYRRCRRILPPYYATLIIIGGLGVLQVVTHHAIFNRPLDLHYLASWFGWHALMIHNLSPDYVLALDAPLWSLALEFQLYIVFPLFVEAYRRWNKRTVLWVILIVCSLYRATLPADVLLWDPASLFVLQYSVFGRCFEFALGMYVADLVARWPQGGKSPVSKFDLLLGGAVIAAGLWRFAIFQDAMLGVVFAALVLAGSRVASPLGRLLARPLLVRIGIFSYSVYLIHQPVMQAFGSKLARLHPPALLSWGMVIFVEVPLVVFLGYFFHLLFERRYLSSRPAPVPTGLAQTTG